MLSGIGKLPRDIQNVVWLQTSFIGDIILSTAAVQLLKRKAPSVRQYLITTPVGATALAGETVFNDILTWDKRKQSLLGSGRRLRSQLSQLGLRSENTVLIQVHKSTRSSLLRRLLGLPTVTYQESRLSWDVAQRVPRIAVFHECARIGMLLEPLGFSREEILAARPSLQAGRRPELQEQWESRLQDLAKSYRLVGVAPGSVWATKRWPAENYAKMLAILMAEHDIAVVLLGSSLEGEQADEIMTVNHAESHRLVNLVGGTKLEDLPFLYSQLQLLICNDSSPIHYASALDIPTLAIFGATVPAMGFSPLASRLAVMEVPFDVDPCRPCSDHGPKACPLTHFHCMRGITAESVAKEAGAMLSLSAETHA